MDECWVGIHQVLKRNTIFGAYDLMTEVTSIKGFRCHLGLDLPDSHTFHPHNFAPQRMRQYNLTNVGHRTSVFRSRVLN